MSILNKYIGYLILGAMLVSAMAYGCRMKAKYELEKERSGAFEQTISDLNQKVNTFRLRLNDSIALYAARVNTLKMSRRNIQDRYDELLRASKVKARDVQNIADVGMVTVDTVRVPVEVDMFGSLSTGYKDAFTTINVNISPEREAEIDYEIRDSITVLNTQKRHSILFGLIKWKETEKTTVISHNPKSKIIGVTSIDVIK